MNFDAQLIASITAYALDSCGRIPASGNVVLRKLETGVKNIGWNRVVESGNPTTERVVTGASCPPPPAIPIDNGFDVTITGCGVNKVFESIIGYSKLLTTAGDITGYTASRLAAGKKIALEILFEPYGDLACEAGTDQVLAVLIPSVSSWTLANPQTFNGQDRSDSAYTGRTFINTHLFDNFTLSATGTPGELAHWEDYVSEVGSGDDWYIATYMDRPTLAGSTATPNALSALVP